MPRIERGCYRGTEVDITQAEHEILGLVDYALDRGDGIQAVDAADELDVRRAPRGGRVDRTGIDVDGLARLRVIPRQGQPHRPSWHLDAADIAQFRQQPAHQRHRACDIKMSPVEMQLQ